ncbi:MAG: hypothetical protein SF028_14835 [Candidatus Sumerlaeia bacterium]|nr:hypothetical protein [Candidatus Sumerlaeia bacterium]
MSPLSRRRFLLATAATGAGLALAELPRGAAAGQETPPAALLPEDFPRQDADAVRETVGASHSNLDRVKELVTARPALAKCAWDWGFGDWETPLGAASHTGRRQIAEFLMSQGARPDLFTFAMLGNRAVIEAAVRASPGIQGVRGPHGITLLQHAKNRLSAEDLDPSESDGLNGVVEYLNAVGGADAAETDLEMDKAQKLVFVGSYGIGAPGAADTIEVALNKREILTISRGKRSERNLRHVEPNTFAPVGAPDVRIRFEVAGGKAVSLTIHDPMPVATAFASP